MRLARLAFLTVGLVALFGLTASASAQEQSTDVQMQAAIAEVPDELPGVYEAHLEVFTSNQGGVCGCTQTDVQLEVTDIGNARVAVLSPSSWTIDWTQQAARGQYPAEHYKAVRATVDVPELPEQEGFVKVTIGGDAYSDNPGVHAVVHPIDLALPLPQSDETTQTQQENASAEGDEGDAGAPTDAVTTAGAEAQEAGLDGTALGTGAGMAGLALVGLAVRRVQA